MGNYKEVSELPNFQQSVNQALSTAGALAGLSGIPQKKAAEKAEIEKEKAAQETLEKKAKILAQQADIAAKDARVNIPGTTQFKIFRDIARAFDSVKTLDINVTVDKNYINVGEKVNLSTKLRKNAETQEILLVRTFIQNFRQVKRGNVEIS